VSDKFDVIIVGAGLAGLAAAYELAGKGLETLVLERGDYPGAKNVSGGRFYIQPVRNLFEGLWERAPFERFIVHEGVTIMSGERSLTFDYSGNELRAEPHQSFSVLRSKFDRWFGEEAEAKGAMLLAKVKVEDVIREHGKIVGVIAGGDELRADVVVACDGVLSLVAEKAGIRDVQKDAPPGNYAVGVKEIVSLDRGLINDRFNLEGEEGAARLFLGDVTRGKFGGGFLYTNRENISLGIVIGLKELLDNGSDIEVPSLIDRFKSRPEIAPLIRGGSTVEYSAHIIPEGGYRALGKLYGEGILIAGDAAGLAMNTGFTVRGMEYAIASGYFAAQAILKAKEKGDFSGETLSIYRRLLEESFVLKDFQNFQATPDVLSNPRLFMHYPEMIGKLFRDIYRVDAGPKEKLFSVIRNHFTLSELWSVIKDLNGLRKI
jgi:electron transfer flavoprotein-quinone oxidoreductase